MRKKGGSQRLHFIDCCKCRLTAKHLQLQGDNPGKKSIVVDFGKPIGDVINETTGEVIKAGTHYGSIRYGSKVHVVPLDY